MVGVTQALIYEIGLAEAGAYAGFADNDYHYQVIMIITIT